MSPQRLRQSFPHWWLTGRIVTYTIITCYQTDIIDIVIVGVEFFSYLTSILNVTLYISQHLAAYFPCWVYDGCLWCAPYRRRCPGWWYRSYFQLSCWLCTRTSLTSHGLGCWASESQFSHLNEHRTWGTIFKAACIHIFPWQSKFQLLKHPTLWYLWYQIVYSENIWHFLMFNI